MSPAGLEGRRRGSRAARWWSSAATTWATSSAATLQPRPARRAEPGGGGRRAGRRRVHLRSRHARARERDAGQDLRARAAVAQGRGDPPRRRHLRGRPARVQGVGPRAQPAIDWPDAAIARGDDDDRADRLGASRRQGSAARATSSRATTLRVYADLLPASDGTAPFAIHTFNQITGGDTIYPRQAAIANDHFVFTGKAEDDKQTTIGREFARAARAGEAVLRDARRRHLSFLFPRAGAGDAGPVHPRRRLAQPRLRRVRRGRHRRRLDDARVRLVDRLHLLHAREGSGA